MRPLVFIFSLLFLSSCTNRKEEVLEPESCDTVNVAFSSGPVSTIISTKCAVTGCHVTGTQASGNFTLYSETKAAVDNGTFAQRVFVIMDMPQVGSLTECELSQLKAWVNAGAPN